MKTRDYKLRYGVFHWLVHFSLAFLLGYLLKLNIYGYLLIIFSTVVIDLDHLSVLMKKGLFGYLKSLKFETRYYPLHRIYFLISFAILGIIFMFYNQLFLGIIFTAITIHMLWDIIEDMIIFKLGVKNWL